MQFCHNPTHIKKLPLYGPVHGPLCISVSCISVYPVSRPEAFRRPPAPITLYYHLSLLSHSAFVLQIQSASVLVFIVCSSKRSLCTSVPILFSLHSAQCHKSDCFYMKLMSHESLKVTTAVSMQLRAAYTHSWVKTSSLTLLFYISYFALIVIRLNVNFSLKVFFFSQLFGQV